LHAFCPGAPHPILSLPAFGFGPKRREVYIQVSQKAGKIAKAGKNERKEEST
jgi:hypothetical protein